MSLVKLVLPNLSWGELAEIIAYLTLKELWVLGCCNRSAFITFLRERSLRKCKSYAQLPARFLSKLSDHEKIALISYPRSGNSFLRKLIEAEFNIVTGSDSRPNRTLAASLLQFGYRGEAITDSSVWVVKSHYPERLGYIRFPVQRLILVIRNPFDAIESYFHMGMTNTHDKALSKEIFVSLKDTWTPFVVNEAKTWVTFHEYWIKERPKLPVLFLRYEDLVQNPQAVMAQVRTFMLEGKPPQGLQRFLPKDSSSALSAGYEPKKAQKFGKALDVMSEDDKTAILTHCGPLMSMFGYEVTTEADPTSLDGNERVITGLSIRPASHMHQALQAADSIFRSLHSPSDPNTTTTTAPGVSSAAGIYINDYFTIRPESDQFGRNITEVRKGLTKNDTVPFPTA